MTPRFDPTRALIVDLARGQLRDEEATARLNLPAHLLLALLDSAGSDAAASFASALGTELGRRAVERMGKAAQNATVQSWTEHLGGQVALVGLGNLSIEQWGKALVLAVEGAPKGTEELLGRVLAAALQRALSRDVELVAFESQGTSSFLVASAAGAAKARSMKSDGAGLGLVVESLHEGAA